MGARGAGIVGVGILGLVKVLAGLSALSHGVAMFYAFRKYQSLNDQSEFMPVDPAVAVMIWALVSGATLLLLGVCLIRFREAIVDRWVAVRTEPTKEHAIGASDSVATAAVGLVGAYLLITGISDLLGYAVEGWAYGWDGESTQLVWRTVPYLVGGMFFMGRPHLISRMWSSQTKHAG